MSVKAYYLPNGPKNLAPLFPSVDFNEVAEYYVQAKDDLDRVVASGTMNQLDGECCDEKIRIHFVNYLGTVDAINFKLLTKDHEPSSDSLEKPVQYPLNKPDHGGSRFNVKSNNVYKAVNTDYTEEDMDWLNELFDSPLAWMEWNGTQGQEDSYIPVIISDVKMENVKKDERYIYEVTIEFKLSHEKYILRN